MNTGIDLMLVHNARQERQIAYFPLVKVSIWTNRIVVAVHQIIKHHHILVVRAQPLDSHAADVSRAACNQNRHSIPSRLFQSQRNLIETEYYRRLRASQSSALVTTQHEPSELIRMFSRMDDKI